MQDINIRLATEADFISILLLCKEFSKEAPEEYTWEQSKAEHSIKFVLQSDTGDVILLEKGGEIIGILACFLTETMFSSSKVATELAWFVTKDHRGSSSSLNLLKAFEEWAKAKGAKAVVMVEINELMELGKVYERLGYSKVETSYRKSI